MIYVHVPQRAPASATIHLSCYNLVHNTMCAHIIPAPLTILVLKDKSRVGLGKSPYILPSGIFNRCTRPLN